MWSSAAKLSIRLPSVMAGTGKPWARTTTYDSLSQFILGSASAWKRARRLLLARPDELHRRPADPPVRRRCDQPPHRRLPRLKVVQRNKLLQITRHPHLLLLRLPAGNGRPRAL